MPNNVTLPGTGSVVEAVEVGGALRQVVQVANLPATQPVSAVALPLPIGAATEATAAALLSAAQAIKTAAEALAGRTLDTGAVSGTVALDSATLSALEGVNATVSGTVSVGNFPATQPVSGTVSVGNFPATQPVSGTVSVGNFPATTGLTDAQLRGSAVPVSLPSLARATDTPFANGDTGLLLLAKRRDSDSTSVSADGDYTTLNMDEAGRLKVSTQPGTTAPTSGNITANGQALFVNVERASNLTVTMVATTLVGHNATFEYSNNSTNGTDGNWYGVQVVRSNANTVETVTGVLAATPVYGWEASVNGYKWFRVRATAHTSGTASYILQPGSYATEPIPAAQVTATQPVSGTVTATVTAGTVNPVVPATPYFVNSAASTNGAMILTGTSNVSSFYATNQGATAAYIKLYNKATAPTVGTDVPEMTIPVPAAESGVPGVATIPIGFHGFRFALGLGIAITRNAVHTDTTAIGAGEVKVKLSRTV